MEKRQRIRNLKWQKIKMMKRELSLSGQGSLF